jgi:integrase
MRIPAHLQRSRHGLFYFRIVVPRALRKALDGRGEIKKSLGTRDLRVALRLARPLTINTYDLFAQLEAADVSGSGKPPTLADILANQENLRHLTASDEFRDAQGRVHRYTLTEDDTDNPAKLAAFERQVAKKEAQFAELRAKDEVRVPEAMLEYQRKQKEEMDAYKAELAAERAREARTPPAATEAAEAQVQREPSSSGLPAFTPDPNNRASVRWAEYLALTSDVNWGGERTSPANERMWAEFMAWWARDDDIRFIDRPLINRFIVYLKTERQVEKGARKGEKGLGGRTVDNYTSVLNTFFTWAQEKEYYFQQLKLPTEGQTLVDKAARKAIAAKAHPPYAPNVVRRLFAADKYSKLKLAHHFWPPLIALFTGARRQEIAQLLLDDFDTHQGVAVMTITDLGDETDSKSVKSAAARRTIPVHAELIKVGLLRYVEETKALGLGPELFPGISANGYGEKGNAIGQMWRRYKQAVNVPGATEPTFHSFRATAIAVLKKNEVPFDVRCYLVGHEFNHVSQNYDPTPPSFGTLVRDSAKLVFEGLDLTPLVTEPNQFDASNRREAPKSARRSKQVARRKEQRKAAKRSASTASSVEHKGAKRT